MKNKNGFTLIELLAIIVILAIIAVITVPIILNIIENSKKGAASDSAYGFKDAVNKAYVTKLSGDSDYNITDNTYTVEELKTQIDLSLSGKEPETNSWVKIEKNSVSAACLQYDEYKVELIDGKVTNTEKGKCEESITPQIAIGTQINYVTSLNGVTLDNWKVFYTEDDYTYLIYGDYLPVSAIDTNSFIGISTSGTYVVTSSVDRETLLSAMTTKTNWSNLLNGTLNGTININETTTDNVWAMGSPTIQLWMDSWNSNEGYSKLYTKYSSSVFGRPFDGWFVGTNPEPTSQGVNLKNEAGYNNTLYFPSQSVKNDCYGYMLASPSSDPETKSIIDIQSIGEIGLNHNSAAYYSLRPIIKFQTITLNQ